MNAGYIDAAIPAVPAGPFALIVAPRAADDMEAALRRMGLQPRRTSSADARVAAPAFRLRLGGMNVLAGPAADAALDIADPTHPATSLLAASLGKGWRSGGRCWVFVPELAAGDLLPPAPMREFSKMLVLLVDLFAASHVFWSPAQLWSDAAQFRAAVAEMLASGMPPVLHLIAFRRRTLGDGEWIGTRGLAIFAGQELEARVPAGWTTADMIKRLARVALDVMLNGPVREAVQAQGLGRGERMALSPHRGEPGTAGTLLVEIFPDMG